VGILQALVVTGQVSYGAAIPIIMGQNIGTCITAILSSFGTNRNAKRTALVHLSFNVIGTAVWLSAYAIAEATLDLALFDMAATQSGIATAHSLFNLACTVLLLPCSGLLEKLAYLMVPETAATGRTTRLDERLLAMPAAALEQCRKLSAEMAELTVEAVKLALGAFTAYDAGVLTRVRELEKESDICEDEIGAYLVKLSASQLGNSDSAEAALLLKTIGDLERIGDYASNIARVTNKINDESITFSGDAQRDLNVAIQAERDLVNDTMKSYQENDLQTAMCIKPRSSALSYLCEILKARHIGRLSRGECNLTQGTAYTELLNSFERIGSHCVAVSGVVRREHQEHPDYHVHSAKAFELTEQQYQQIYDDFLAKYDVLSNEERPLSVEDEAVQ
jgi:phosphate:Na+ symporter